MLFPHEILRPIQDKIVSTIERCVKEKICCAIHAPTGLGKTAASIAPALESAIKDNLTVVFCTPRHTQHIIALKTAELIRKKHGIDFNSVVIVGRRHLCAHDTVKDMESSDFSAYCKSLRSAQQCPHFTRSRSGFKFTFDAELAVKSLYQPVSTEQLVSLGMKEKLCPYELALLCCKEAKLIITDYHYLFSEHIRNKFLAKIDKKPNQLIVIVDEAHNLPSRVRESLTHRISELTIKKAINEAKQFGQDNLLMKLVEMDSTLKKIGATLNFESERIVQKEEWSKPLDVFGDPLILSDEFAKSAEVVHSQSKKHSSLSTIAGFIDSWINDNVDSYTRIIRKGKSGYEITLRCLDPAIGTSEFIKSTHSTILMSGTLRPVRMFTEQLGMPSSSIELELPSPFPSKNRMCVIVPSVTTKFTKRDDAQYDRIAGLCRNIIDATPGCSAFFFPSYALLERISDKIDVGCKKTIFRESQSMNADDRKALLERFSSYKSTGAALLGVASGSFGEGIDLPGILKSVTVVGIPLEKPDIETQQLIAYYDRHFGKGWDYGYTLPALMRTMQNAGRCIRSSDDKGVLLFLDERYAWPSYKKCFPEDWDLKQSISPDVLIKTFFNN